MLLFDEIIDLEHNTYCKNLTLYLQSNKKRQNNLKEMISLFRHIRIFSSISELCNYCLNYCLNVLTKIV